jgi:hypothetical protein
MKTPQAILLSFTLVAAAVLVVGFSHHSEADKPGPWQIAAGGNQTAWRVNTETGATWFCSILAAPSKPGCQAAIDLPSKN